MEVGYQQNFSNAESSCWTQYFSCSQSEEESLSSMSIDTLKAQTSKHWQIVAIVVGSLFTIAAVGAFIGLLHSYGLISLPSSCQAVIGTIGHTPHYWSLWTIAAAGIVAGVSLISYGAQKVHQAKMAQKELDERDAAAKRVEERIDAKFNLSNLDELQLNKKFFQDIPEKMRSAAKAHDTKYFRTWGFVENQKNEDGSIKLGEDGRPLTKPVDREDRFFILMTRNDVILGTKQMNEEQRNAWVTFLEKNGYEYFTDRILNNQQ